MIDGAEGAASAVVVIVVCLSVVCEVATDRREPSSGRSEASPMRCASGKQLHDHKFANRYVYKWG